MAAADFWLVKRDLFGRAINSPGEQDIYGRLAVLGIDDSDHLGVRRGTMARIRKLFIYVPIAEQVRSSILKTQE
jgi:hypothetical protein